MYTVFLVRDKMILGMRKKKLQTVFSHCIKRSLLIEHCVAIPNSKA